MACAVHASLPEGVCYTTAADQGRLVAHGTSTCMVFGPA
jgi:acyl-coenzyme A thioesterase PaaI-like protein